MLARLLNVSTGANRCWSRTKSLAKTNVMLLSVSKRFPPTLSQCAATRAAWCVAASNVRPLSWRSEAEPACELSEAPTGFVLRIANRGPTFATSSSDE